MTVTTLSSLRADDSFDLFWDRVNTMAQERDVSAPQLLR